MLGSKPKRQAQPSNIAQAKYSGRLRCGVNGGFEYPVDSGGLGVSDHMEVELETARGQERGNFPKQLGVNQPFLEQPGWGAAGFVA
jgi:hypothetical protein